MGYSAKEIRMPWENRFEQPTIEALRSPYNKQLGGYHDTARDFLLKFDNIEETIDWHGLPWRWSSRFDIIGVSNERGWVYLVPDPEGPRLSIPLTEEMVEKLPKTRLKKHVREGIDHAKRIGDVRWTDWEITGKAQLDDLLKIAKRTYAYLNETE